MRQIFVKYLCQRRLREASRRLGRCYKSNDQVKSELTPFTMSRSAQNRMRGSYHLYARDLPTNHLSLALK